MGSFGSRVVGSRRRAFRAADKQQMVGALFVAVAAVTAIADGDGVDRKLAEEPNHTQLAVRSCSLAHQLVVAADKRHLVAGSCGNWN